MSSERPKPGTPAPSPPPPAPRPPAGPQQPSRVIGEQWLTVDEAAAKARISATVVRRWIHQRQLPWTNVSEGTQRPRIRIRQSALEQFLAARERAAAA